MNARTVPGQAPLDYQTEQAALDRRRRMAEALSAQAQQPIGAGQMVGDRFVRPSWTQGLAQLLKSYQAGQQMRSVDADAVTAARNEQTGRAAEVGNIMGQFGGTTNYTQDGMTGGMDAQDMTRTGNYANPNAAIAQAMSSTRPQVQNLGGALFAANQATMARDESRDVRSQELAQARDFRSQESAQALAGRQDQLRVQQEFAGAQGERDRQGQTERQRERIEADRIRQEADRIGRSDLVRLAASLRAGPQPQTPIAVMGPNGPEYVSPQSAIGRQPPPKAGAAAVGANDNLRGMNDAVKEARDLLTGTRRNSETGEVIPGAGTLPTASGFGRGLDIAGNLVGIAVPGSAQSKALQVIAGKLTMAVPRMQGPQSDRDVALYKEMSGDIANATLPIAQRLSALDMVEKLIAKYEPGFKGPQPVMNLGNIPRTQQDPIPGQSLNITPAGGGNGLPPGFALVPPR